MNSDKLSLIEVVLGLGIIAIAAVLTWQTVFYFSVANKSKRLEDASSEDALYRSLSYILIYGLVFSWLSAGVFWFRICTGLEYIPEQQVNLSISQRYLCLATLLLFMTGVICCFFPNSRTLDVRIVSFVIVWGIFMALLKVVLIIVFWARLLKAKQYHHHQIDPQHEKSNFL